MLSQVEYIKGLQPIADIISLIVAFLQPFVEPIGKWMVTWITVSMDFLKENVGREFTLYITICLVLIVLGVIINIIWPGDKKGSILKTGEEKFDESEETLEGSEESVEKTVKRCDDCGNPIGDQDMCPLCGARN